jgi:hypothetical protein
MAIKIEALLHIFKSAPMQDVQRRLIDIACQWTASGCVEQANRLLALARETGDLSTFAISLAAFEIPWSLSGTRPTNWPPSAQDIDAIELDLWERLFGPQWARFLTAFSVRTPQRLLVTRSFKRSALEAKRCNP